jgi:hypothetical protein
VGDVNADGRLDIAMMGSGGESSYEDYPYGAYDPVTIRSALVLLGNGDGSFEFHHRGPWRGSRLQLLQIGLPGRL